jgi:hypothetical protein
MTGWNKSIKMGDHKRLKSQTAPFMNTENQLYVLLSETNLLCNYHQTMLTFSHSLQFITDVQDSCHKPTWKWSQCKNTASNTMCIHTRTSQSSHIIKPEWTGVSSLLLTSTQALQEAEVLIIQEQHSNTVLSAGCNNWEPLLYLSECKTTPSTIFNFQENVSTEHI